jgi:thiamine biosynthesis protein ThiS
MKISVNGDAREYSEDSVVSDIVADLQLTGKRIAIEFNKQILPFDQYSTQKLKTNDCIEIVQAIGGGQDDFFYNRRAKIQLSITGWNREIPGYGRNATGHRSQWC